MAQSKIYVGNLSFKATTEDVEELFREAGHPPTKVDMITDRETGRFRGFAFITIDDSVSSVEKVCGDMNGQEFQGRPLTVNEARPQESRSTHAHSRY